jgi:hypothetical protein
LFVAGAVLCQISVGVLGILLAPISRAMGQFGSLTLLVVPKLLAGSTTPVESIPGGLQHVMQVMPTPHFVSFAQAVLYRAADLEKLRCLHARPRRPLIWIKATKAALRDTRSGRQAHGSRFWHFLVPTEMAVMNSASIASCRGFWRLIGICRFVFHETGVVLCGGTCGWRVQHHRSAGRNNRITRDSPGVTVAPAAAAGQSSDRPAAPASLSGRHVLREWILLALLHNPPRRNTVALHCYRATPVDARNPVVWEPVYGRQKIFRARPTA